MNDKLYYSVYLPIFIMFICYLNPIVLKYMYIIEIYGYNKGILKNFLYLF